MTIASAAAASAQDIASVGALAQDRAVTDDPVAKQTRSSFRSKYKLAILDEYERLPEGEKGSLLRREGLYSSHIVEWRRARDAGR